MAANTAEYRVFVNTTWIWLSSPIDTSATADVPPRRKPLRATYPLPVEKWDTDSDSPDGADDELDRAV